MMSSEQHCNCTTTELLERQRLVQARALRACGSRRVPITARVSQSAHEIATDCVGRACGSRRVPITARASAHDCGCECL
jgi:hypothetical protein